MDAKKGAFALVGEDLLDTQLQKEKEDVGVKTKRFFEFSREWWAEYTQLNQIFKNRAVKIFANDLYGAMKPVCYFLRRLHCRGISTPEEAARFVSLIPFEGAGRIEHEKTEWQEIHSFLAEGRGNAVDHALLLCSLLLGFSLDAYVCLGSSSDGAHAWVVTSEEKKFGNKLVKEFKFWESLTGKVYSRKDPRVNYLYRRIGCIFNDKTFFANLQKDDTVPKKYQSNLLGNPNKFGPQGRPILEDNGRYLRLPAP